MNDTAIAPPRPCPELAVFGTVHQSSCLTLVLAAVERSKTKRFTGPAVHVADGEAVLKLDNRIPHVSIHGDLDTPAFWTRTGRAALVVESSRKDAKHAVNVRVMRPGRLLFGFVFSVP